MELDAWLTFKVCSWLLVAALDRQLRRDAGISHSWYAVLAVLSDRPTRTARQSGLAAITDFSLTGCRTP